MTTTNTTPADIPAEAQELEQQLAQERDPYRQLELLTVFCKKNHYSNSQLAYTYAGRMLEIAEELQDKYWMGRALYAQVTYEEFFAYRDSESVIERLSRAAQLFEEVGDVRMQAKIWSAMADEYNKLGEVVAARELYIKALDIFRQYDDRMNYASCKYRIAVFDSQTGRLKEAVEGLMEALRIYRKAGDLYGQGICHSNLGAVYMDMKDYQRAIGYYSRGRDIAKRIGQPMVEAIEMINLANAYMETGDIETALQNYSHAQQVFHKLKYKSLF